MLICPANFHVRGYNCKTELSVSEFVFSNMKLIKLLKETQ